jgi:hypothetical protein
MTGERKKNRRPRNPVMRVIEDSIESLVAQGAALDTEAVTNRAANHMRVGVLTSHMEMLLTPFARRRLVERGYMVTDSEEFDRAHWTEMGPEDYEQQEKVQAEHREAVAKHLRATVAVRKYLSAKEADLGRPVTAGEFEGKVVAIYDRYGISV